MKKEKTKAQIKSDKFAKVFFNIYWFFVGISLLILLWLANFILALKIGGHQNFGTVGDSFGAMNAFVSGLTLVVLITAVVLQRVELRIVRDDREDTRQTLDNQIKAAKAQSYEGRLASFDNGFFKILELFLETRNNVVHPLNRDNKGVFAFYAVVKQTPPFQEVRKDFIEPFVQSPDFQLYLQTLEVLIKHAKSAPKHPENNFTHKKISKEYMEIISTQITGSEIRVLASYIKNYSDKPEKGYIQEIIGEFWKE